MAEIKKVMALMRTTYVANIDLGLEIAKNIFPNFYKWFQNKVTSELMYLHDACVLTGNMTAIFCTPTEYINKFRYKNHRFFYIIRFYILSKGYLRKSRLTDKPK